MKPARRDMDPRADSHAGDHGGFSVQWIDGWFVLVEHDPPIGPFHTSQAAFGAAKDAIDELIREEMKR